MWRFVRLMNRSYRRYAGGENRLAFYDIDKTLPSLRLLDKNYTVIREEMEGVLEYKDRIPRYHDLDKSEMYISGTVDPGKGLEGLHATESRGHSGGKPGEVPSNGGLAQAASECIPSLLFDSRSGRSIPAHCGTYLGYLRYHLGLRVPANKPPSMRVKDTIHTWEEGRSILFDDSLEHEVYNKSDDLRVVLIVDLFTTLALPLARLQLGPYPAVAAQRGSQTVDGQDQEVFLILMS